MLAHGQTVRVTAPCVARAREGAKGTPHATIARITPVRVLFVWTDHGDAPCTHPGAD